MVIRAFLSLCLSLFLFWPTTSHKKQPVAQEPFREQSQDKQEEQRQKFKRGKDLLERRGVPFEPETLLDPDWKNKLAPTFAQMPEMRTERKLSKELKGVQLADTLYLPEKIELTGDTVIVTRRLLHEGKNALIKGNHNIYIFVVEESGLLGKTLEEALNCSPIQGSSGPLGSTGGHLGFGAFGDVGASSGQDGAIESFTPILSACAPLRILR